MLIRYQLVAVIGAGMIAISPSQAQQSLSNPQPARVPVALVLADMSDPDGFQIVRRVSELPRDVILLSPSADGHTLSRAVQDLLIVRGQQGDTATSTGIMRVRHTTQNTVRVLRWAERVLTDLRKAEPREVAGLGRRRAIEIWLPPQGSRPPRP